MSHSKLKFALSTLLHLLGIFVLSAVFASLFISETTAMIIYSLLGDQQISEQILTPLVITLGLSTVFWGVGVFAIRAINRPQVKTLKRARGSIMTETLIVLPVFLLLTSGLAQMGINSMAGLLTTVGAFEAGRTLAVWGPEEGNARINGGVTRAQITERARIAVAVIVAPVAKTTATAMCAPSATLNNFLRGMTAAGVAPVPVPRAQIWSFMEAFGTETFAQRGPTKVVAAYCAVSIDGSSFAGIPTQGTTGGDFTVKVTYAHKTVFPLVDQVFGTGGIERSYQMRSHIPPNDCLPESPNFFNLGNCN